MRHREGKRQAVGSPRGLAWRVLGFGFAAQGGHCQASVAIGLRFSYYASSEPLEVTIPALTVHDKSMRIIEAKINTTLEAWLFRSF